MNYAVRITRPYKDLVEFFDRFETAVVYQHDADTEVKRTHCHALLIGVSVSTDTMKNWVTKSIGLRPSKSDWAFVSKLKSKPITEDFITYMSKGKLEPSYIKGFTQEQIDSYKCKWIERTEPAKVNKDGSKHKHEVTNLQIAQELARYIQTGIIDYDMLALGSAVTYIKRDEVTKTKIVLKCIELHNKYEKTYIEHSLMRIIQTAIGLCDDSNFYKQKLVENLASRIYC